MNHLLLALVALHSMHAQIDPALVLSVIKVESKFNPSAVGTKGEIGLMQIMPKYHPTLTRDELFDVETNVKLGVAQLAECKRRFPRGDNSWVVCFNAGITGAQRVSALNQHKYYKAVMKEYAEMSKIWKRGQMVVVLGAYYGGSHGEGKVLREDSDYHFPNHWLVDIGDTVMRVSGNVIVDREEFHEEERRKRGR